ncbi:MAG: tRNA 2-thiouridine(34) synthase MnmA [Bacteroidaceae bacterium]
MGTLKNTVLLGMSGGTDSSVAAMLLQEAGYKVTGVTFRFWDSFEFIETLKIFPNALPSYIEEAKALARSLNIEHFVYDARATFRTQIVNYFISEYMAARTPVPCAICNNLLKWPLLAQLADEKGIEYIATGHYVRLIESPSQTLFVRQGLDPDKDQSFFLWGLSEALLRRIIFPLGEYTKTDVRAIAAARGYQKVATKRDSLGVCFCPMDYRSFLRRELGTKAFKKGSFLDSKGNLLGQHEGYPFYTIGQRRKLGIWLNRQLFVTEIRPQKNEIVLGSIEDTARMEFDICDWHSPDPSELLSNPSELIVKIRYKKQLNRCRVREYTTSKGSHLRITLQEPLTAIASGQAAAFYLGDRLLGGGIIL